MALVPLDQLRPLLDRLREAETLTKALEDRERVGWARLHICHVGGLLAEDRRPMADLADDVIAIAQGLGIPRMEGDAYFWAACWSYALVSTVVAAAIAAAGNVVVAIGGAGGAGGAVAGGGTGAAGASRRGGSVSLSMPGAFTGTAIGGSGVAGAAGANGK